MESPQINNTLFKLLIMEMIPTIIEVSRSHGLSTDQVNLKIELLGYKLGIKLNELLLFKLADQFSKNNEDLETVLDIMKFICKDFWKILFKKQISNLRTNHRGTFVLVDSNFKPIENFDVSRPDAPVMISHYLSYVNGVMKGTLKSFGINSVITNEINFPSVTFNIETDNNN
ncbi:hypothetical protein PSN45_000180 [Yamadazyma tenuis]|uniref:Transport protein particle component n=1 Tax=Candida tenuis (strain ATCC 10573 / BCRC 21748 / CBS 615 / JCM 9827 / NBRC 10315 / NRRL Y-1498 / VKM Y-70) TaxID=590646 RepID=G3BB76_CANTC|nr:transport protein particle component [Yamadazyma tenuis ATCC 10573]EGV61506.1 transport protein particle component [Yamadazyma tenuis ATCC 10573]WEJ92725.1 hypothetical protein PSN45_000180 [Yamadazyma tenuis]